MVEPAMPQCQSQNHLISNKYTMCLLINTNKLLKLVEMENFVYSDVFDETE